MSARARVALAARLQVLLLAWKAQWLRVSQELQKLE
jgi:hypothetical protein